MRHILSFLLCMMISLSLVAQDDINFSDDIYLDYIKSVKFHHSGLFTSMPIIDLGSNGRLILSFDDLEAGDKDFIYKIIHCDKNWQASDLDEYDYINGFNGEEIEDIAYSRGTYQNYTHYRLSLPNDDLEWTISGNYILAIYEDEYDTVPAITRRFMVVEPLLTVLAQVEKPMTVSKIRTHHEIDFKINFEDFRIVNPMNEIEVTILQNKRWDTTITGIKPRNVTGDNINFKYVDRINFPGGKEFRLVDLRSTRYRGQGVHSIDRNPNGIDMLVQMDQNRYFKNYHTYDDINGQFVIETADDNNPDLESEYMNVYFSLQLDQAILEGDVYIVGGFCDWKLSEANRMEYDYFRKIYSKDIRLKQGFYDYSYAVKIADEVDFEALEGNSFETENEYTILTYLSEFGARYDRLVGVGTLNSGR